MASGIKGISHLTFSVGDLDRSIQFYTDVFDARLLLRGERMAYLDVAGIWIALNVQTGIPREEIRQSYTHVAFAVDPEALDGFRANTSALGVALEPGRSRDGAEGQSLYFRDPDGHLFELHTGDLETRIRHYRESGADLAFEGQP